MTDEQVAMCIYVCYDCNQEYDPREGGRDECGICGGPNVEMLIEWPEPDTVVADTCAVDLLDGGVE